MFCIFGWPSASQVTWFEFSGEEPSSCFDGKEESEIKFLTNSVFIFMLRC